MTSGTTATAATTRPPVKRPDSLHLELLAESTITSVISTDATQLDRLNVEFKDLSYVTSTGFFRKEKKTILHEVSGEFHAGDLTAIMGPSGAGKSTLMNILAGYMCGGEVSGAVRDAAKLRARSCYIMQDDQLQPLLTVREAMFVAASLKLPGHLTSTERGARVREVLKALGLYECRRTRTGSLSGGQRKRLAVALELVRDPPVLFFDEPTSGLDSSSSRQLVELLRELARGGRTVICTIHQPSATIFGMFDHLYALAEGRCIYQGCVKGLLPYLSSVGLRCPPYHNLADYLLEVARCEYGDRLDTLVQLTSNGTNQEWRSIKRATPDSPIIDATIFSNNVVPATPVHAPSRPPRFLASESTTYAAPFGTQLLVLLKRTVLIMCRDRQLTYGRLATSLVIGLVIGTLYFNIGSDAQHTLDNFNYVFFTIMFLMFTAFNYMLVAFANDLPILRREYFNRWYSVCSYFVAVTIVDLPLQFIATLVYTLVSFYMTSQPPESFRYGLFLGMCVLISLVAQSCGQLVGASCTVRNGVIFGPFAILPFVIFSGFFVHLSDAPTYLQWLFHLSFMRYGFEGAVQAVFGYNRPKLHCGDVYCHFVNPEKFIDQVGMGYAEYSHDVYCLLAFFVALRLVTYCTLWARVATTR